MDKTPEELRYGWEVARRASLQTVKLDTPAGDCVLDTEVDDSRRTLLLIDDLFADFIYCTGAHVFDPVS